MSSVCLIGAGGHARVVYDALRRSGYSGLVMVRDDNPDLSARPFHDLSICVPATADFSTGQWRIHVAIGENKIRAGFIEKYVSGIAGLLSVVHPCATCAPTASYGDGCFFAAQSVMAPDAHLGMGCIVNHGAVVDHDCEIGDFTHIAPRATLGGGVRVGSKSLIGSGAVVLPGIQIGNGVVIGAGAVVLENIPDNTIWAGVPAYPLS